MTTIPMLVADGEIVEFEPSLDDDETQVRCIYFSQHAVNWMKEKMPNLKPAWVSELSLQRQSDTFLEDFCAGVDLTVGPQFHNMEPSDPNHHGIWELKTADLRYFGWFYRKNVFIVWACNQAGFIKEYHLENGYRDEAVLFRESLDLDPPPFVPGNNPYDVITEYNIP